jgi:hypothetical protein
MNVQQGQMEAERKVMEAVGSKTRMAPGLNVIPVLIPVLSTEPMEDRMKGMEHVRSMTRMHLTIWIREIPTSQAQINISSASLSEGLLYSREDHDAATRV